MAQKLIAGLAGNPNSGKTTLFNALTGLNYTVGNFPGVTVEQKSGSFIINNESVTVVDLPGIYSLSARSLDEEVTRDFILTSKPDVIINIIDASALERNLYLTVQLIEMNVPIVLALNMMDVVRSRGIELDVQKLAAGLGCPVVPIVARTGEGLDALRCAVFDAAKSKKAPAAIMKYPQVIEEALGELASAIEKDALANHRWLAIRMLENSPYAIASAGKKASALLPGIKSKIESAINEDAELAIVGARYAFIQNVAAGAVEEPAAYGKTATDKIDKIVLNRWLGLPAFALAMFLMFFITINIGGSFVDFFDGVASAIFVDGVRHVLGVLNAPAALTVFLADGVGGSIALIAALLPPIGLMFLCLAALEDSGYMARAAFVTDRLMRFIGLPGKAFVPMLVGFGCNVPAILATRTLERQRDRLLTIAINPFMSCSARFPVYAFFGLAFFAGSQGLIVFSLYAVGVFVAVVTALLLKLTVLRAPVQPFVMELPPYHVPSFYSVARHAWLRLSGFAVRAGKVIVAAMILMSFLNSFGFDGKFGHEGKGTSVIAHTGRAITPIFRPMGITDENWPAAVGLFSGLLAKEAVVGTLGSLYSQLERPGEEPAAAAPAELNLLGKLGGAVKTIPANLARAFGFGEAPPAAGAYSMMAKYFDGRVGAYAYLLFILLYSPCIAAIGAIYRETNCRWTAFIVGYLTAVAWMAAVGFYQAANILKHPAQSAAWLAGLGAVYGGYILILRSLGKKMLGPYRNA